MAAADDNSLLQFRRSFGYDSKRLFNLCLIDNDTLVFASGNVVHFFNTRIRSMSTRLSENGSGIGYITKNSNPRWQHLTIAENGTATPIYIYKYPEMQSVAICRNGAERAYTFVSYSADGELMVSQGDAPDYSITVWKWADEQIILKYPNEFDGRAVTACFSAFNVDQLVSAGIGHIKFWTICRTFTGLKLKCMRGRFEKRDVSDIMAVCSLSDGRVLSGCQLGNILLWHGGYVEYEVCRKGRQPCHAAPIMQIQLIKNRYVWTIGGDGFVRVWLWESIEMATPHVENDIAVAEVDPLREFRIDTIGNGCRLVWMVAALDSVWYAQDANNGIWRIEIESEARKISSELIFRCHGGKVVGLGVSELTTHLATLGSNGSLHVYDYIANELIMHHEFDAGGSDLMWLPQTAVAACNFVVLAFDDGSLRLIALQLTSTPVKSKNSFSLTMATKCHTAAITKLSVNGCGTILISGSQDQTVFLHQIDAKSTSVCLLPIGFVELPSGVTALTWKPQSNNTVLIGCRHGHVIEAVLPDKHADADVASYRLNHDVYRQFIFRSIKSQALRDMRLERREQRMQKKINEKREKLARMQTDDTNIEIDEQKFLEDKDSEQDEDKWCPLYVPETGSRVLWMHYSQQNTIWMSMGDFDCGFLYEYDFGHDGPIRYLALADAIDQQINHILDIFDVKKYILLTLDNGEVRLYENYDDLAHLSGNYLSLRIHDNAHYSSRSFDERFIFSIGFDGNICMYDWRLASAAVVAGKMRLPDQVLPKSIKDIESSSLSLEEGKQAANQQTRQAQIDVIKSTKMMRLGEMITNYQALKRRNKKLPEWLRYTREELTLDDRIKADYERSAQAERQKLRQLIAYDVEKYALQVKKLTSFFIGSLDERLVTVTGIRNDIGVRTFPMRKMSEAYLLVLEEMKNPARVKRLMASVRHSSTFHTGMSNIFTQREQYLTAFCRKVEGMDIGLQLSRLIKSAKARAQNRNEYERSVIVMKMLKPNANTMVQLNLDERKIIGALHLKTDFENFSPAHELPETMIQKIEEFDVAFKEMRRLRKTYNDAVSRIYQDKMQLCAFIQAKVNDMGENYSYVMRESYMTDESEWSVTLEKLMNKNRSDTSHDQKSYLGGNEFQCWLRRIISLPDDATSGPTCECVWSIRKSFQIRLRHQQEQVQREISSKIATFDESLLELKKARLNLDIESNWLQCHTLMLQQELWIIRESQHVEHKIIERQNHIIEQQNDINLSILSHQSQIEVNQQNIRALTKEIEQINQLFEGECNRDAKYSLYLRRIYRKKPVHRGEQSHDDINDDELTSGPDESDEDDFFRVILDPSSGSTELILVDNVCPVDCNPKLFEMAHGFRALRLAFEENLQHEHDLQRRLGLEIVQMEEDEKMLKIALEREMSNIKELQVSRHKHLNEIDALVIIRTDQIKHAADVDNLYDIRNAILVDGDTISRLDGRAAEIQQEILQETHNRRALFTEMQRLRRESRQMAEDLTSLKRTLHKMMISKFGMIVDVDELEKGMLETLWFQMKIDDSHIRKSYETEDAAIRRQIIQREGDLLKLKKLRIEKYNILILLQNQMNIDTEAEQTPSESIINIQKFEEEVRMLKAILSNQTACLDRLPNINAEKSAEDQEISLLAHVSKQFQMQQTVQQFLSSYMPHLNVDTLEKFVDTIVKYVATKAQSVSVRPTPDELAAVIAQLEGYLPSAIMLYAREKELLEFFLDIHSICYPTVVEGTRSACTFDDLVGSIIMEAKDLVPKAILNYSDVFLADFVQALLDLFDVTKLMTDRHIESIVGGLCHALKFYPMQVSEEHVIVLLRNYGSVSDEVTIRAFLREILTKSRGKYHINDRMATVIS